METSEMKSKLDIMNINKFVNLEKRGSNYVCPCPFHQEASASFVVSPKKNIFKCFGCGESGDYVSFYARYNNMPRKEAYKIILGYETKRLEKTEEEKILNTISEFYQTSLNATTKGLEVIKYFNDRGFTEEEVKEFNIGLVCGDTYGVLKDMKYSESSINKIDFLSDKKGDIFFNRIAFPITENGQILGFTCRRINDTNQKFAKYLNSRESKYFKKGEIFFNLDKAKNAIKENKSVIIAEGTVDVMSYYVSGVKNVVATCGVALTQNHLLKLKALTNHIILAFDSDSAGFNATLKSYKMAKELGFEVSILLLNHVKDANDYMLKFGRDKLKEASSKDITIFAYLFKKNDFSKIKKMFFEFLQFEDIISQKEILNGLAKIKSNTYTYEDLLIEFANYQNETEANYFDCIVYHCLNDKNKIKVFQKFVNKNLLTKSQKEILNRIIVDDITGLFGQENCYDFNILILNFIKEKMKKL